MFSRLVLILVFVCLPCAAAEQAEYDSNGRVIALLAAGGEIELATDVVAVLPNGKRIALQRRRDDRGASRRGRDLAWTSPFQLPGGGGGRLEIVAEERAGGLRYSVRLAAESPLDLHAVEFALKLPGTVFLGGRVTPDRGAPVDIGKVRLNGPELLRASLRSLRWQDRTAETMLELRTGDARLISVLDLWGAEGRLLEVRIPLCTGPVTAETVATLDLDLSLTSVPKENPAPVRIAVDPSAPRYRFDGFGGNYCWNNQSPVAQYTLENLKLGWGRTEMKLVQWDRERNQPGPEIRADMDLMRRLQKMGVPYAISIWWLPERFYVDGFEKPRSTHFRLIHPERWAELLDLIGSFLVYAKREYGVEPDLFSFNEANIGVYVGLTPEAHTDAIKRIGARFRKLGLKTRMLLGDATGPRDTHRYILHASADAEAMRHVGAIGFHSWGGATAEQYRAWGDVAEWLGLPLLVTELGLDPAAHYTRSWDSFQYGLREARMTQELLVHARPQGTQYWQFTNDYGLARVAGDGTVEPTGRFWLMKHFTDLTPRQSQGVRMNSGASDVLVSAFQKERRWAVHILNLGPARAASVEGLPPAAEWRTTLTAEGDYFRSVPAADRDGAVTVELPARSLVTLTAE